MKIIRQTKTSVLAFKPIFIFFKRSMLEQSEQQIRAASGLEELLRITHFEDWKLWRCRLKLKSFTSTDSRSASHRSTRFAATFYDIETLKGRYVCVEANSCSFSDTNKCTNLFQNLARQACVRERNGGLWFHSFGVGGESWFSTSTPQINIFNRILR